MRGKRFREFRVRSGKILFLPAAIARRVVALGGIQDQIVDGESGILISDPTDLREFGTAVAGLLAEPERAQRIGVAARARVSHHFLGPRHLGRYFDLIQRLVATGEDHSAGSSALGVVGARVEAAPEVVG